MASERFDGAMRRAQVTRDIRTEADLVRIWCGAHHKDRTRRRIETDAAVAGVYGRRVPVLCEECEQHLAYAEKRRAFCPHDPKPFCAYCDTQCYRAEESAWQRQVMRYAGPRSMLRGHFFAGIKHLLDGRARKRELARRRAAASSEKE